MFSKIVPIILVASSLFLLTSNTSAQSTPQPNQFISYRATSIDSSSIESLIYVVLNNGFSTYPPSVLCIDGIPVFETSSGAGVFEFFLSKRNPREIWIPYFGDCVSRSDQDSSIFVTQIPGISYIINAKILSGTAGTTITPSTAPTPTPKSEPTPSESGNTQQIVQTVTNPSTTTEPIKEDEIPEFIAYALKSTSISTGRPIPLDASLVVSRTRFRRNQSVNITLSNVVRLDPSFKDATCELMTSRNSTTPVATAKLDEAGRCVISWTPGNTFRRGRINAFLRILDGSRDHTYITNNFNLNIT